MLDRLARFLIDSLVGAFWCPLKFLVCSAAVGVKGLLYGTVTGDQAAAVLVILSVLGALDILAWGLDRASRTAAGAGE